MGVLIVVIVVAALGFHVGGDRSKRNRIRRNQHD